MIRREAIITHLVFVHSLRVRLSTAVKPEAPSISAKAKNASSDAVEIITAAAETHSAHSQTDDTSTITVTDESGITVQLTDGEDIESAVPNAPAAPASDIAKNPTVQEDAKAREKGQDQIGKINNMISSDLRTIHGGSDWLTPSEYTRTIPIYDDC